MPPIFDSSPGERPEGSQSPRPPSEGAPDAGEVREAEPLLLPPPRPHGQDAETGAPAAYASEPAVQVGVAAPPIERPRWGPRVRRFARELVETLILALLIFLAVRSVVQNFRVEGSSMNPGLENGQYLLVNKAIYFEINLETIAKFLPFIDPGDHPVRHVFRAPRRGDVIVFEAPKSPERDFIKRVIGEPSDVVAIQEGTVFVNNVPLDEPYVTNKGSSDYGPETVPADHYFVLGDNRANSYDSRAWGMLPEENIIGQAWISYWPFSAWGFVNNTHIQSQAP
jgi:signal peptidase I